MSDQPSPTSAPAALAPTPATAPAVAPAAAAASTPVTATAALPRRARKAAAGAADRTPVAGAAAPKPAKAAGPARKTVAAPQPGGKPAAKVAGKVDKTARPAKVTKAVKVAKPAKTRDKLVRDSFTMPASDFALIDLLKTRALANHRAAKKSELLRAGLQALAKLDGTVLVATLDGLTPLKLGRPKKGD